MMDSITTTTTSTTTTTTTAPVSSDKDGSPAAHLWELWQDEAAKAAGYPYSVSGNCMDNSGVQVHELDELDLLSEEGIIQEEWLLGSSHSGGCNSTSHDASVHCISPPQDCYSSPTCASSSGGSLLPLFKIDLVSYDLDTLDELQWKEQETASRKRTADSASGCCTFYNYPPMTQVQVVHGNKVVFEQEDYAGDTCSSCTTANKRRKVCLSNACDDDDDDYIPSMADLDLPVAVVGSATTTSTLQQQDEYKHAKQKEQNNVKEEDPVAMYLQNKLDDLVQQFQASYASVMESKQRRMRMAKQSSSKQKNNERSNHLGGTTCFDPLDDCGWGGQHVL